MWGKTLMRKEPARGIALLGMTALCFLPVLAVGGFAFDDAEYVRGNPLLADWEGLRRIWWPERVSEGTYAYGVEQHYWPILYTTYWIEHKLWGGFWGPGFHATNVALHCANAWLLWRLLENLSVPGAWAVACVFAIHPSQMEAVASVIGRKDVLSTLCVLAALHVWTGGGALSWSRVAGTAALGGIGVLSKTPAVLLLGYLVLAQWWRGGEWSAKLGMKLGAVALPMAGLGAWGWYAYENKGRIPQDAGLGWAEHLMLGPTTWWNHLYYSVVPDPAGLGWHFWALEVDSLGVWAASMGLAAVAVGLWAWRKRLPKGVLIAAVGFTVAVAPYLGVIDHQGLVGSFNNSRHRYVAALFPWLVIIGGWLLWEARMKVGGGTGARWAATGRRAGIVTGAALALTMQWDYGFAYTSDAAWYAHLIRTSVGSPVPVGWARDQQIAALLEAGQMDEALEKATQRAALYPAAPRAKIMLGLALEAAGRVEEGRDVLLGLLAEWNRPGGRAQRIGYESFREIRDGGVGPGPIGMPVRYMVVMALARMEQAMGRMDRAKAFEREGVWLVPKDREWTFRRADGTVYRIGGEREEDK